MGLVATACLDEGDGNDIFGDPMNGAPADDPFAPASGADDPLAPANGAGEPLGPPNGVGDPLTPPNDGGSAVGAQLSGTVADVAGVGVSGSVAVAEVAGEAEVDVLLTDLPEGAYPAHITAGDCTNPGQVAFTLGEVQAGADGDVEALYAVPVSVENLAIGHSVIVEDAEAEVVACAEIG